MAKLDFDALNATIRYLMFSVFAVRQGALGDDRTAVIDETATFLSNRRNAAWRSAASTTSRACGPTPTS